MTEQIRLNYISKFGSYLTVNTPQLFTEIIRLMFTTRQGTVRINVTPRRIRVTTVAVEKH